MTPSDAELAFRFPDGIDAFPLDDDNRSSSLSRLTLFGPEFDTVRDTLVHRLAAREFEQDEDRVFGALFGLVIGDALGAPLEFSALRYGATELTGFDEAIWTKPGYNAFGLRPGQWTDDASMALCLADSLLIQDGLDGHDLRLRFLNWWRLGYCNAFGFDEGREDRRSIGRGGNVYESFAEFMRDRTAFTTAGTLQTSGNGTLMRNAPAALFARHDAGRARALSYQQSKTTHQGEEAAECCRLLTHAILRGLDSDGTAGFLNDLDAGYRSDTFSVHCLAAARQEASHPHNEGLDLAERNWAWRDADYRFAPSRAAAHPDYIGSYAMDALAMALHCVWATGSFEDAVLRCANLRGDADTTAAITGQIAGAIYGFNAIPAEWVQAVMRWDPQMTIGLRARALFRGDRLTPTYLLR